MSFAWLMAISVPVAALIGGATNYVAIKMLFHPRNPIVIGGRKLPFTPGLIPKRKQEIAQALGQVVGEYLVTSDGLRGVLTNPDFQRRLVEGIRERLARWSSREGTVEDWLAELRGAERLGLDKRAVLEQLERAAAYALRRLWEQPAVTTAPLAKLLPDWGEEKREAIVRLAADAVLNAIAEQLLSPSGDLIVRRLTARMLEQAGGMLGTLAGIFMDEQKVSAKVRQVAVEQLKSAAVREAVERMIEGKVRELERMTVEEAFARLSVADVPAWAEGRIGRMLEEGVDYALGMPMERLRPLMKAASDRSPEAVAVVLDAVAGQLDRIVSALDLPQMVERQVSGFPIERLEQVVLSVSGKEFRAITWLGALLGGLIGLLQALAYRYLL